MNSNIRINPTSAQTYARFAGVLYLIIIVIGFFVEIFIRSKLIVSGDATATANNIMASEFLWRIGFVGSIIMLVCAVPLALIMYILLSPVNGKIALLAVFFNLVSIAIEALNNIHVFAALFPLGNSDYLKVFEAEQLHMMAYHSLRMHTSGYNLSLVFFGVNCFFWGYLLFKSTYFPRILGVLLIICSVCYVTNSFAWFLVPKSAAKMVPAILVPCLIAELSLSLWLIFTGINIQKWEVVEYIGADSIDSIEM